MDTRSSWRGAVGRWNRTSEPSARPRLSSGTTASPAVDRPAPAEHLGHARRGRRHRRAARVTASAPSTICSGHRLRRRHGEPAVRAAGEGEPGQRPSPRSGSRGWRARRCGCRARSAAHSPSICSNGWTTWAWWPSTRSTSGEASRARTASTCAVGGVVVVLQAAVQARDDDLRPGRPGPGRRGQHRRRRRERRRRRPTTRAPAGNGTPLRLNVAGDVPDPDAADVDDRAARCSRPASGRCRCAAIPAASRSSSVRTSPSSAVVERVVGGRRAHVVAGAGQRVDDLRLDGEARVAAVRAADRGDRGLQVADREVGGLDQRRDRRPGRRRSRSCRRRLLGAGGERPVLVDQHVAGRHQREARPRRSGPRRPTAAAATRAATTAMTRAGSRPSRRRRAAARSPEPRPPCARRRARMQARRPRP